MNINRLFLAVGLWIGLHNSIHGAATVRLNNYDVDIPIRLMWSADSKGTNLNYQVFAGVVGQSLAPLIPVGQTNSVLNWETCQSFAGYFDAGVAIVPGVLDNSSADFQVRAWVGLPGSTYEESSVRGESIRWTQNTGSWDSTAFPPTPAEGTILNIPEQIAYPPDNYYLLTIESQGKGDIAVNPPSLFSGYTNGSHVTVAAIPSAGEKFWGWKGISETNNPLVVTITNDLHLTAVFTRKWNLNITTTEGGTVNIEPNQTDFWDLQDVQVTAKPSPGYNFIRWESELGAFQKYPFSQTVSFAIIANVSVKAFFRVQPPKIFSSPNSQTVTNGSPVTFKVIDFGYNIAYQWYRNDVMLAGETNSSCSFIATPSLSGSSYKCVVSNESGLIITDPAFLYVLAPPPDIIITGQPTNQTVFKGEAVTFQVIALSTSTGTNLNYQWRINGIAIPGATNSIYTIKNAIASGPYSCIISNPTGYVASFKATLFVIIPQTPIFIKTEQDRTVKSDFTVTLSVQAMDNYGSNIEYLWIRNGMPIPAGSVYNRTNNILILNNVTTNDSGKYVCIARNSVGNTETPPVLLTVLPPPPPRIMVQPQSQIVRWGEPITLRVDAIGAKPLFYQWCLNGMEIPNATNATFIQEKARGVDAGIYMVAVNNAHGRTNSTLAYVPIVLSPNIIEQPRSQLVTETTSVYFWIKATGIEPISYQWRFQGIEIPGETNAVLTLTNVTTANNGLYQVEVKNEGGTVLSASALLTVTSNPQVMNIQISQDTITLTLKTRSGAHYSIQQSPDMRVWMNIGSFDANSEISEFKTAISEKRMFYRIKAD